MSVPDLVLLVGGPLDGERRPWPKSDETAVMFGDIIPLDPARGNEAIPEGAGFHRYVRTQIMVNGSSGGAAIVFRYGSMSRFDALDMLVDHYPDRRYSPPASLDDPA